MELLSCWCIDFGSVGVGMSGENLFLAGSVDIRIPCYHSECGILSDKDEVGFFWSKCIPQLWRF